MRRVLSEFLVSFVGSNFFDFLAMILLCYVPKIVAVYDLKYMFNIPTDRVLCSVTPKIFMNMAR